MNKLYAFFVAIALGTAANAQYDLAVILNDYTAGEDTSDDPLVLDFTIVNNGITIPSGDSIFWVVNIGADYYSTDDLTANYVVYTVLGSDLTNGQGFAVDVADITMEWMYNEAGLTSTICASVLGVNIQETPAPTDLTPLDNQMCVDYTVTEVAGLNEEVNGAISAYPNPASTVINFDLAGNSVDYIKVFDMSGREVSTLAVTGSIESFNVEEFENGVYFYQMLFNGEVVKTDKFSVVK